MSDIYEKMNGWDITSIHSYINKKNEHISWIPLIATLISCNLFCLYYEFIEVLQIGNNYIFLFQCDLIWYFFLYAAVLSVLLYLSYKMVKTTSLTKLIWKDGDIISLK